MSPLLGCDVREQFFIVRRVVWMAVLHGANSVLPQQGDSLTQSTQYDLLILEGICDRLIRKRGLTWSLAGLANGPV